MEQVFGQSRFHDQILAVGQTRNAQGAFLIREQFGQAVFVGVLGGYPAVTLAVGVVLCCGQAGVVFLHQRLVRFIHPGNRRALPGEIVFRGIVVVAVLAVGVKNALHVVAAIRIAGELVGFGQLPHAVDRKAGTFQLGGRAARAGGADNLLDGKAGFQNRIFGTIYFADNVRGFAVISQSMVVVGFIAQIPLGIAQIITVVGLYAGQGAAFSHSAELVFVDIVGVFAAAGIQ